MIYKLFEPSRSFDFWDAGHLYQSRIKELIQDKDGDLETYGMVAQRELSTTRVLVHTKTLFYFLPLISIHGWIQSMQGNVRQGKARQGKAMQCNVA
ncbi:hypothetical protein EYC84_010490 [Monilinia fructicola]|uniref:Uncharacterized protein n=1 Tax=Monilinia fructicola TaxID=38448 RepID=A0A5M9JHP3_MONFR|nr:hypothetical protein EYC84_010490 [Monilinia fructicola]